MLAVFVQVVTGAFACESTTGSLLAPVDPISWGAANANWGKYQTNHIYKLRAVVNGQIVAHQVNCSFTCGKCRAIMRTKCFDPVNCVMCSNPAMKFARDLRDQISGSIETSQDTQKVLSFAASLKEYRASADRYKAEDMIDEESYTEIVTQYDAEGKPIGQVTNKHTVVPNKAVKHLERAEANEATASRYRNVAVAEDAGSQYFYVSSLNDATEKLRIPDKGTVIYAGQDQLR